MLYQTGRLYNEFIKKWNKCRDVISGEDEVKQRGEKYLPKPNGMSKKDYAGYLTRAKLFNATGRTAEGLHGMMFRKPVNIEVPESLNQYMDKVDKYGNSAQQFIQQATWEAIITNWCGVLVDYPETEGNISVKQAEDNGLEPFLVFYKAEDIYVWRWNTSRKDNFLDLVILHEEEEVISDNGNNYTTRDVYRVLELKNGVYTVTIKKDGKNDVIITPKMNGKELDHIPFFVLPEKEPLDPMMLNLVNTNLAWYRKSADLENGLHWTGVPTPYIIGYTPEIRTDENGNEVAKDDIELGGSRFLLLPETVTQIGYLEFSGAGLSQLQNEMQADEERMAILGARIISAEKKGVESAEAAKIHRAGENSVLASFANSVSDVLQKIFVEYLSWCSNKEVYPDDVVVEINTDYSAETIDYGILTQLMALVQQGRLSMRNLWRVMQQGEIGLDNIPYEQNLEEIEEENGGAPPIPNTE